MSSLNSIKPKTPVSAAFFQVTAEEKGEAWARRHLVIVQENKEVTNPASN